MFEEDRPLPSVLYKYFPVESWLARLLTGESLEFSSRATFNDPFDSRPPYKISAPQEARVWVKSKVAHIRNPAMRLLQQQKILTQSGKVRNFGQKENDQVLDDIGVCACLRLGTTRSYGRITPRSMAGSASGSSATSMFFSWPSP